MRTEKPRSTPRSPPAFWRRASFDPWLCPFTWTFTFRKRLPIKFRRRGVDVLTAIEDGFANAPDESLLARANELSRVLYTQDIGFKAMAESWQSDQRACAGLLYGHQLGATIGKYVADLELIATASETGEWGNSVQHLPL